MKSRLRRHLKIRKRIIGTEQRPRLSVFRSNQHIIAQVIDDSTGKTIVAASDLGLKGTKLQRALEVGQKIAKLAVAKKIKVIVFDRGGFLYHWRVSELAKGAREGGLEF